MLELEASRLTLAMVWRNKFYNLLVHVIVAGNCLSTDHLLIVRLNAHLYSEGMSQEKHDEINEQTEQEDEFTQEEMDGEFARYGRKAPETRKQLNVSYLFSLVFQTSISVTSLVVNVFVARNCPSDSCQY